MVRQSVRRVATIIVLVMVAASGSARAEESASPRDTQAESIALTSPSQAAASFHVPDGFRVEFFAAEPDVRQPDRDGLGPRAGGSGSPRTTPMPSWHPKFDLRRRDRVLIFEDADGDGRADSRTVFTDDVQRLTSVEVGLGGVWAALPAAAPLRARPRRRRRPRRPARGRARRLAPSPCEHNIANGLRWGPDGWLYGRCGILAPRSVGPPGTPEPTAIPISGGLWRYHPDAQGVRGPLPRARPTPGARLGRPTARLFFINTVNGHLWHAVPGAHFAAAAHEDPNPHVYALIDQHADHFHWDTAKDWNDSARPALGDDRPAGGGHAHSGLMIYQGDNWPERVPRQALHPEPARPTAQRRAARTRAGAATSAGTSPTSSSPPTPGSAAST